MALNIALPRIPVSIEQGNSGSLDGTFGPFMQDYHRSMFGNVSFVVIENEGDTFLQGDTASNGQNKNTSALTDLFLRNEVDIFGLPIEYGSVSAHLLPACPVANFAGAALHAPLLSTTSQNVLSTLNIFPLRILVGIFASVVMLGLFLSLSRKVDFFDTSTDLAKCIINQTNFNYEMQRSKALILFWLISAFAIMELYEQSMNADIVSLDYSSVVESVMDLDRHKSYKPTFIQGEFIRERFKRTLDPVKKRIWNRQNREILNLNLEASLLSPKKDNVLIGVKVIIMNAGEYSCGVSKNDFQIKRPKFLIGSKDFSSVNVAFYYRANLSEKLKQLIWYKSQRMSEGGFAHHLAKKCTKPPKGFTPATTSACICNTKEDLYDHVETLGPIKTHHFSSLIALLGWLLAFSSILLIVECSLYVSLEVLKRIRRDEVVD